MPYRDEAGVKHVSSTDPISDGSRLHLLSCKICQTRFPNNAKVISYLTRYEDDMGRYTEEEGSSESVMADPKARYIEDDLKVLREIDKQIADLISQRHERMDMIKAQQEQNLRMVQSHDDWFEGNVRGNPVPERPTNGMNPRFN